MAFSVSLLFLGFFLLPLVGFGEVHPTVILLQPAYCSLISIGNPVPLPVSLNRPFGDGGGPQGSKDIIDL